MNVVIVAQHAGSALFTFARQQFQSQAAVACSILIGGFTIAAYLARHYLCPTNRPKLSNDEITCHAPNIHFDCGFKDFREPNEGCPKEVEPHIERMEKGWIVSTGTERSFYNLALSNPEQCDGLIVLDIHPLVKAYCDFLICLLLLSNSREEFVELSKMSLNELRSILIPRLLKSDMSEQLKSYYIDNFDILGNSYLPIKHIPHFGDEPRSSFSSVNYRIHDDLFLKLQKYAREGKIITKVGDIRDLKFASGRKITVVDISNLPDYIFTKFE